MWWVQRPSAWDNGHVSTSPRADTEDETQVGPRHIEVVGGRPADWRQLSDEQWVQRLADLGKIADHAGASWLTVRPFGPDPTDPSPLPPARTTATGGCVVVADPETDGRARLTRVIGALAAAGEEVSDSSIMHALNAPAETDPDLVVVLGNGHELPPSMVWELAYCELVFLDVSWADLHAAQLDEALATFLHRHRRFGGLD